MANTKTNAKKKTKAPAAPVKDNSIPYYERYLLTIDEAAAYFHIGSKKMVELVQNHEGAKCVVRQIVWCSVSRIKLVGNEHNLECIFHPVKLNSAS